jgi:hypothetical protein
VLHSPKLGAFLTGSLPGLGYPRRAESSEGQGLHIKNNEAKMKNKLPKYLVRPKDFRIFYLNDDETYSMRDDVITNYIGNKYSYDTLIAYNFFSCEENEIEKYEKMTEEYYDELKKVTKNDGHGGVKYTKEYLNGELKYFKPKK